MFNFAPDPMAMQQGQPPESNNAALLAGALSGVGNRGGRGNGALQGVSSAAQGYVQALAQQQARQKMLDQWRNMLKPQTPTAAPMLPQE